MCLGIPAKIIAISDPERLMGVAEIGGVTREVNLACVAEDPLAGLVGRWALIHVGFAMSLIDEAEAQATLDALAALGEAEEEIAVIRETDAMLRAGAA